MIERLVQLVIPAKNAALAQVFPVSRFSLPDVF
jgi:hypothetical protein